MIDEKELDAQAWRSARKIFHESPKDISIQDVMHFLFREVKQSMQYACQQSCCKCGRDAAERSAAEKKSRKPLTIGLGE